MEIRKEHEHAENIKYNEPSYAREKLEKGEFAVGYFHGQTFLFIPRTIGETLGMQRLRALAEQIFGEEVLDEFAGSTSDNYELSFLMELPPQENRDNNQVTKLIQITKDEAKK